MLPIEGRALVDALDHVAVRLSLVALDVRAEPRLPVRVLLVQQRETWRDKIGYSDNWLD